MPSIRPALATSLLLVVCAATSCTSSPPPPPPPVDQNATLGALTPAVSVKELMHSLIDPGSDYIFNAVGSVMTKDGPVDTSPTTDEDWEKLKMGAVTMAEGASLLKVRRPFAPPGDLNDSVGPDASELSPDAITAKVNADPVEWNARVEALRNVGLEVLDIVKRKDASELWDAGANLDNACESCHKVYWYPKEDAEWYRKLDKRLKDYSDTTPAVGR